MSESGAVTKRQAAKLSRRKVVIFSIVAVAAPLLLLEAGARLWLRLAPRSMLEASAAAKAVHTNAFHQLHGDLDLHDSRSAARLYQPDAHLFWRLRPNTSLQPENIVYVTRGQPVRWTLNINAQGRRGSAYPSADEQAEPVIACFGDSCTFGYRVNDDETYPVRLEQYLRAQGLPHARVLNDGVPGYTTFQGHRRLAEVLPQHRPDVVILAFGANDHELDLYSDAEKARRIHPLGIRLSQVLDHLAIAKVARGLAAYQAEPEFSPTLPQRVSEPEYRENLRAMVQQARQAGARVVLLDMVFFAPLHRAAIAEVAEAEGVDWLDCRAILQEAAVQIREGKRFEKERAALDQFWNSQVASYRQVYYSEEHYRRMFRSPLWSALLRYVLIEPVHPNELGYRIIAEHVGQRLVEMQRERKINGPTLPHAGP